LPFRLSSVSMSALVLGTGNWVPGYPFQYPLPGYPLDTRVPAGNLIPVSIVWNQPKFGIFMCSAPV